SLAHSLAARRGGFSRARPARIVFLNMGERQKNNMGSHLNKTGRLIRKDNVNRRARFFLLLVAAFACSLAASPAADLRQSINFNREWKFQLGDVSGAEAPALDDAKWDDASLPHSFSMPYFAADRFYTGYGWYRKHFNVPAAWT